MKDLTDSIVRRILGSTSTAFIDNEATLAEIIRAVNLGAATEGAKRSLLLADSVSFKPVDIERSTSLEAITELPKVQPTHALRSLLEREPRLAGTVQTMAEIYSKENAFAIAKASSLQITEEAQRTIARLMADGTTVLDAGKILSELDGWSQAYGEVVYRTNTASAYTNGMFAMTGDPAVADVIGALRLVATHDSTVRPNHLAFDGLLASPADPIWHVAAPPLGFNCRCSVELVPWADIPRDRIEKRTGKVTRASLPSGAFPDNGFRKQHFNPGLAIALAH